MAAKKAEKVKSSFGSKFSLIELLSILILVGLLFVFIVPVNQAKISRSHVAEAVQTIDMISKKAEAFKNNPDNGYYPDISQLNLGKQVESDYFEHSIAADDSTVLAQTKPPFGVKGAYITYSMSSNQFRVGKGENDKISSKYISTNWLP
jgi:Tfp pilus assembly protein PilE